MTALFAVAAFATLSSGNARAEYPDHPVTIVACFPAGGGTDLAMRMFHVELGKALGQTVIIENRGGAGGSIGTGVVARATPDGYTLLGCSSAFVVNPSLYEHVPYDPFKDFTPIMVIGASPNVFVVPSQSKIQSMKELIAQAKANPGKMNWTSPGIGTTPQLAGELLKIKAGLANDAYSLCRRRSCQYRRARRPGRLLRGQLRLAHRPVEQRQGAADRGDVEEALARSAECADAR